MPTRLVLVDDDDEFREVARTVLGAGGFEVAGESATGLGAVALADDIEPEVVLLDVQLPDIDGFEVLRRMRARGNVPRVVLTSTREAADYGRRVAMSGADGFITKSRLTGATLRAILHAIGREKS